MAPWLPNGRIRAHEHERGGFSAGASGRINQRWVKFGKIWIFPSCFHVKGFSLFLLLRLNKHILWVMCTDFALNQSGSFAKG